ncbi:uncharacterized protein LOC114532802 isoform X2 [Dendronephthya gigantea]|uniref:uncharacterized protein LOC114532802 isoform X2 n=1 Tax=Dendronephthya gigantea TaxID=151771 RepID=UPI00106C8828|nr:uncharacterized protein LOC114532802 isoform X2 [Dendronephthya gigantea]
MTMAVWVKLAERMMPSFFRAPAELKPLPASAEDFKEELRLFENLDRDADPPPRAKLYHCLLLSVNIKRPFNSTMILVVGSTGVGKSSTINHLLDTGEGIPVALTSCSESETKATSEYILTTDDSNYEVCDLKMGIIDTPGLNDTAGVKQDACNFVSIKRFFETHPGLPEQSIYPNLVFLVVNVNDTRVKGKNSSLSKCLRGIKLLEVVDTRHPNLVVVVTHCCSVSYKNLRKWKDKMKEKKDTILAIVFEALGVSAPVVLIENDFDGHDLKKEGDFTILPNGDRQPKNLYDACAELLHRNKDNFGLLVFNSCFTRAKKDRPTEGHKVEAEDSKSKELSDEEEKFLNAFSDDARRVEAKDSKSEELSDEEEEFSNAFSDDAKRDLQPFYDQKEKCQLKYQKYIPVQPRKQPITREGSITEPYIIIGFAILNELVKKFWKVITGYFYAQDKLLKKDRLDENYYSKALTRLEWLKSVKFVDGNEECSERHLEIVCKLGRVPRTKDIYDIFGKDSLPLITYKEDSQEEWFKTHVLDENSDMKTGFKCKLTRLEWLESFKIVETNQGGTNESRLEIVCKLGKVPCTRDIVNIFSKDVLPFISYREDTCIKKHALKTRQLTAQ